MDPESRRLFEDEYARGPNLVGRGRYRGYKVLVRDLPEQVTRECCLDWLGLHGALPRTLKEVHVVRPQRRDAAFAGTTNAYFTCLDPEDAKIIFNEIWMWSFSRWVQQRNVDPDAPAYRRTAYFERDWMVSVKWVLPPGQRHSAQAPDPARLRYGATAVTGTRTAYSRSWRDPVNVWYGADPGQTGGASSSTTPPPVPTQTQVFSLVDPEEEDAEDFDPDAVWSDPESSLPQQPLMSFDL